MFIWNASYEAASRKWRKSETKTGNVGGNKGQEGGEVGREGVRIRGEKASSAMFRKQVANILIVSNRLHRGGRGGGEKEMTFNSFNSKTKGTFSFETRQKRIWNEDADVVLWHVGKWRNTKDKIAGIGKSLNFNPESESRLKEILRFLKNSVRLTTTNPFEKRNPNRTARGCRIAFDPRG